MPALGIHLLKFFPPFLLSAVFAKVMDPFGARSAVTDCMVEWTVQEQAILSIVRAFEGSPRASRIAHD